MIQGTVDKWKPDTPRKDEGRIPATELLSHPPTRREIQITKSTVIKTIPLNSAWEFLILEKIRSIILNLKYKLS